MSQIEIYHCTCHSDTPYESHELDSSYFRTKGQAREWFRTFKKKMEQEYKLERRWREGEHTSEQGYSVEYSTNGEITLYCTEVLL